MHRTRLNIAVAIAALPGVTSCGLIDLASFDGITFQLPEQTYTLSTDDPRWKQLPQGGVPPVTCGGAGALVDDCCSIPTVNCGISPMSCEAGMCALKFTYEVTSPIDLAKDVPQLTRVQGSTLSEIRLKSIETTMNNRLSMALPDVLVYVAPGNVDTASHPDARLIATIPSKPAGYEGTDVIELTAEAQDAFAAYASDFQTPFNIIMSTTVVMKSGATKPTGQLDVKVGGKVEAKL